MIHKKTQVKLDRLQEVLREALQVPGPVSISAIGRRLGMSRQAVTYQLQILATQRGIVIPEERLMVLMPFHFVLLPSKTDLDAAKSANVDSGNDHGKPKLPASPRRGRKPLDGQRDLKLKEPTY